MDEQLEQVIKQLESWSENHTKIPLTVEIGFCSIGSTCRLRVFENLFVFENGVFNVLFQPARCDDVSGVWQEIGASGYWLVNFRHHGALATLFETTTPERRTTSVTLVHRARRATLI